MEIETFRKICAGGLAALFIGAGSALVRESTLSAPDRHPTRHGAEKSSAMALPLIGGGDLQALHK